MLLQASEPNNSVAQQFAAHQLVRGEAGTLESPQGRSSMPKVKTEPPADTATSMTAQIRAESPVGTESSTSTAAPWSGLFEPSQIRVGAAERRRARVRKMGKGITEAGGEADGSASPCVLGRERRDDEDDAGENLLEEDRDASKLLSKKQQRMIRNRESAALSRKRKRDQVQALELEVQQLKDKNRQLKQRLSRYENMDSLDSARSSAQTNSTATSQPLPTPGLPMPRGPLQPWFNASTNPYMRQGPPGQQGSGRDTLVAPPPASYYPQGPLLVQSSYLNNNNLEQGGGSSRSSGGGGGGGGGSSSSSSGVSTTNLGTASQLPPPPSLIGGLGAPARFPTKQQSGGVDGLLDVMPLVDSMSDFYYGDNMSNKPASSTTTSTLSFSHVDSRDWDMPPQFSDQHSLQAGPLASYGATPTLGGPGVQDFSRQQSWSSQSGMNPEGLTGGDMGGGGGGQGSEEGQRASATDSSGSMPAPPRGGGAGNANRRTSWTGYSVGMKRSAPGGGGGGGGGGNPW
jgi:hypothetical protein